MMKSKKSSDESPIGHLCPWWLGYLLINPFRRIYQNPVKLLGPFVEKGMTVLEPGCGMGYFTLDVARLVGPGGRIVADPILDGLHHVYRFAALPVGWIGSLRPSTGGVTQECSQAQGGTSSDVALRRAPQHTFRLPGIHGYAPRSLVDRHAR